MNYLKTEELGKIVTKYVSHYLNENSALKGNTPRAKINVK
jgi:hypothetical protein